MNKLPNLLLVLTLCITCCKEKNHNDYEMEAPFRYAENIKFNHLYVVIDDSTYKYLFDSIAFFHEFAYVSEDNIDAGDESWSGKYITGNQDYLEIFKPSSAEDTKLGNLGIGFMPNKMGIQDSLYTYWGLGTDSIHRDLKTMVISEGDTIPWFNAINIHNPDSLAIIPWVMEYTDTFMKMAGFTEEELTNEISHAEFTQKYVSTRFNISYDSAQYKRLYERVSGFSLELSQDEYNHFNKYLKTFGFEESDDVFIRPDFEIRYQLTEGSHFTLKQIDFELREAVESQSYTVNKLTFSAEGKMAQMLFH